MNPDRKTYLQHKAAHAMAGLAVQLIGHHLGHPAVSLACAWALGVAKELYDKRRGGRFRFGDMCWTGALATLFYLVWR